MELALYGTIWIALALFALGEAGKRGPTAGRAPAPWAWWAFALGAGMTTVHVGIAMGLRHGWSHDAALAATARQTAAVYGLAWGGGVYVNYAFLGLWAFEAWHWRRSPARYASRPQAVTWLVRAFFFVVIVNAAVVFAPGWRRAAGALIAASLVVSWWPRTKGRSVAAST